MLWQPQATYAQAPSDQSDYITWDELHTDKFTIVYAEEVVITNRPVTCRCGVEEAEYYAAFIDEIYDDLVAVFEVELETPVNLRLFPTEESYIQVNPLARQVPGVIAHALNSRDEIAVALPRTELLTDEDLVNNMRHEITHLFASLLSDGKLTTGFQEGIAQYLEKPSETDIFDTASLEQALAQNELLTWAELDQAEQVYSRPQIAYPQARSVVSFLIDRYELAGFITFIEAMAEEPGYRSAIQVAYGQPADTLEAEWLSYLPEYLAGRWQVNAIYAYDLSRTRTLVENAAYSDAVEELEEVVKLLETTEQNDVLVEATALFETAKRGQAAGILTDEAREALEAGDYPLAISKGNAAITAYSEINFVDRIPEIQNYIYRAELGQTAMTQLSNGESLIASLRFFEAERQLQQATAMLQSLDNEAGASRGERLLNESAQRQRFIIYLLIGAAGLLLIFNTFRRIFNRVIIDPLEVEFR